MEDKQKIELLQSEYLHIQRTMEDFDSRALSLKIWATCFGLSLLGLALYLQNDLLLCLPPLSTLIFWLIETQWKTFQYAHYERAGKIEAFFAGKASDIRPMQIGEDWYKSWKAGGISRFIKTALRSHVILPHGILLCLSFIPVFLR